MYEVDWHPVESGQLGCVWRLGLEEFVVVCHITSIEELGILESLFNVAILSVLWVLLCNAREVS